MDSTPPCQQKGNHSPQAEPSHAGRIIEAQQALRRAQASMAPSRFVTTLHASRSKAVVWYEEHEESLRSLHSEQEHSRRRAYSPEQLISRDQAETRIPPSIHPLSERVRLRRRPR